MGGKPDFTFLIFFWAVYIFFAKFSGAFMNPAISLGMIIKKEGEHLELLLGLCYILVEFIGGIAGAFLFWLLYEYPFAGPTINDSSEADETIIPAIVGEIFGTFFLTLIYMMQFDQETSLNKDAAALWSLGIAGGYGVAIAFSPNSMACFNPAMALGLALCAVMEYSGDYFKYVWIHVPMPFVGGLLAALFFRFIIKKLGGDHKDAWGEK